MGTAQVENLVIIGSGPAGFTAAIYAGRAFLKPVVLEGFQVGGIPGGQLMTTTEVENFPGFPNGITGPQLMERMRAQAQRWQAELYTEDATRVDLQQRPFFVESDSHQWYTHSLIIATGALAKRLHLPSEEQYWNRGVSACAVCDGAMPIFRNVDLVVVGGGDTACEEATYLSKFGSHVHLLVRRDELRASKAMQERLCRHPKITIHWTTTAIDVIGDGQRLTGVKIQNTRTGQQSVLPAGGFFYAIGHTPNTALFQGQLELDPAGYIITQPHSLATTIEGVFAAGDVQDPDFRQAITAAGSGCMAALLAERWLSSQGLLQSFPYPVQPREDRDPPTTDDRDDVEFEVADVDFEIFDVVEEVSEVDFEETDPIDKITDIDFAVADPGDAALDVDFEDPHPADLIPERDPYPIVQGVSYDRETVVSPVTVTMSDSPDHSPAPQSSIQTLREALAFFLEQDNYIDRFEAEGLKNLILQDGQITPEEHAFLEEAIRDYNFDSEALKVLKDLLSRHQGIKPDTP